MNRRSWLFNRTLRGVGSYQNESTPPFLPSTIPDAYAWYRSDLGITLGTGVAAWADQIGTNDLTQGAGGSQPPYTDPFAALNNQPVVGPFDGAADYLRPPIAALSDWIFLHDGTGSTVVVYGGSGALGTARRIVDTNGASGVASGMTLAFNAAGNMLWNMGTGSLAVIAASSAIIPANTSYYAILRHNTAGTPDWSFTVNGTTTTGTNSNTPGTANPVYVPNIGRRGSSAHYYNGLLSEILFVKRAISDAEVTQLQTYFTRYVP